ncbi:carbonic anhydrase [Actinomadura oligospora]|uniref:carbonic anhydrase n=1 Tax=Actinomadura oligospora TaxID=111804 RepID=UPI00047EE09B|nr:carbonic anhydrase [Actinomadura oligospora]
MNDFSRRMALRSGLATGGLGLAALVPAVSASGSGRLAPAAHPDTSTGTHTLTPAQAWRRLARGNHAWATGARTCPDEDLPLRHELAHEQHPFAVVVSCIDSRVPPETVFDQGLGSMFVVRTGAQTVDGLVTGSIEYGPVEHATPLIVVMGHQRCGAVKATVESIEHHHPLPPHLNAVVDSIRPAYERARRHGGDVVDRTIRIQTLRTVAALAVDPVLVPKIDKGVLGLVAAYYSLDTGRVSVLRTVGMRPS